MISAAGERHWTTFASPEDYQRLPPRPRDGYDWRVFFGDQKERPLIYHGTSSVFAPGIAKHGLGFHHRPYDMGDVDAIVKIFERRELYGPGVMLSVLHAYTRTTAARGTVSLTFDWGRACRYAIFNPGGETIAYIHKLTSWALSLTPSPLNATEEALVRRVLARVAPIVEAHRPVVAAIEFDPQWVEPDEVAFFSDRGDFERRFQPIWLPGLQQFLEPAPVADVFVGHGLFVGRGKEFASRGVPPTAVRRLLELAVSNEKAIARPWEPALGSTLAVGTKGKLRRLFNGGVSTEA